MNSANQILFAAREVKALPSTVPEALSTPAAVISPPKDLGFTPEGGLH